MIGWDPFSIIENILKRDGNRRIQSLPGLGHSGSLWGDGGRLTVNVAAPKYPANGNVMRTMDRYFDKIMRALEHVRATLGHWPDSIILQGGGSMPISEELRRFCEEHGIALFVSMVHEFPAEAMNEIPLERLLQRVPPLEREWREEREFADLQLS